jgi:hypothetical protein
MFLMVRENKASNLIADRMDASFQRSDASREKQKMRALLWQLPIQIQRRQ